MSCKSDSKTSPLGFRALHQKGGITISFIAKQMWEYLVRDFLEIKCTLKEPEQEFLLNFLKGRVDAIRMHPAFSVDDLLVIVTENGRTQKSLFYHP